MRVQLRQTSLGIDIVSRLNQPQSQISGALYRRQLPIYCCCAFKMRDVVNISINIVAAKSRARYFPFRMSLYSCTLDIPMRGSESVD
jgi:hypothetical protein